MLQTILMMFAKPLGAAINNVLQAGATAVTAWAIARGAPGDIVVAIVSAVVGALSLAISGFAATQGVTIPVINADQNNGVKVVPSTATVAAVNTPLPGK